MLPLPPERSKLQRLLHSEKFSSGETGLVAASNDAAAEVAVGGEVSASDGGGGGGSNNDGDAAMALFNGGSDRLSFSSLGQHAALLRNFFEGAAAAAEEEVVEPAGYGADFFATPAGRALSGNIAVSSGSGSSSSGGGGGYSLVRHVRHSRRHPCGFVAQLRTSRGAVGAAAAAASTASSFLAAASGSLLTPRLSPSLSTPPWLAQWEAGRPS